MEGYDSRTYGRAFADVYDSWYAELGDLGSLVATLADLVPDGGRVCELGIGTGRVAIALAEACVGRDVTVVGIDSSPEMLGRLGQAAAGHIAAGRIVPVAGDMVDDMPAGPFDLVAVAFNTIFNLTEHERQAALFAAAAQRLAPGGRLAVEAIAPEADVVSAGQGVVVDDVAIRELDVDRVVLSVSRHHLGDQVAEGQFVEFTEAGGVRLRPWRVRYATIPQLDAMAAAAGLSLERRHGEVDGTEWRDGDRRHLSVWRRLDP
jgi:SAM-dependent methyltransferase